MLTIEIDRTALVKEPWTTVRGAGAEVRPALVSSIKELPDGQQVAVSRDAELSASKFRVIDDLGPCYEFDGVALIAENGVELSVEGTLRFLR